MNLGYAILLLFMKEGAVMDSMVAPAKSKADCVAKSSQQWKDHPDLTAKLDSKGISVKTYCVDISQKPDFNSDSLKPKQKTAPEGGFKDDLTITPSPKYETKL